MWIEIKSSKRGICTTDDCLGQPAWRLEAGDVGSDYCSACALEINRLAIEENRRARALMDKPDDEPGYTQYTSYRP